jgi:AcrR family transcriptional regulator
MAKLGRPRNFDREKALGSALYVFWALGYEATTLLDLQKAMGDITPTSFYAAFGSKERLFREVVELYNARQAPALTRVMNGSGTARDSIEALLRTAVQLYTGEDQPRGCLLVLGAVNCSRANEGVQELLRNHRLQLVKVIRQRLERGVRAGDLPAGRDLNGLASFYSTFLHGLSIQARDGVSRKTMEAAVNHAMAAWQAI